MATTTSGSLPTKDKSTTALLRSRSNVGSHSCSLLQLPHKMAALFSIRQLHSTIRPNSPCGLPDFPERRVLGVRCPNSKKMAEPCPRQRCDKGKPISAPRHDCKTLTPSLLKFGSPDFLSAVLLNGTPRGPDKAGVGLHKPNISTFCASKRAGRGHQSTAPMDSNARD